MEWHLHPESVVMAGLLMVLYWLGARWAAEGQSPPPRPTRAQVICYSFGVLTLYVGASSPLHDLSERYLFSAHMVQHTLFSLVAPPLILLGTPGWMLRPLLLKSRLFYRFMYEITRPFAAFAIFNLVILVTHLPPVVNLTLTVHWTHFVAHVFLVGTALIMWMPVLSPLPELPRIGPFAQMVYLFVQSFVPGVIASFLAFANNVVYEFYANAPKRMWGISAVNDQRIAGVFMKLIGAAILWGFMAVIFFRWFGEEDRAQRAESDAVQWDEVEKELERMGLTRR